VKIALASDIHLEFGPIELANDQGADVLILAGDICQAVDAPNDTQVGRVVQTFFRQVSDRFPRVIYIMGNHEHYQGDFARSRERLQRMLDQQACDNVHLLEKDVVTIQDVTFVGGTLWTDFNRADSLCMWHAGQSMSDYKVCRNSGRGISGGGYASRLQPEDALADHKAMLDYIRITTEGKTDQKNFDTYRMIRHNEAPKKIDVHFVQNEVDPTGLGEPPFPPIFGAMANALYKATGKRFYQQPFQPQLKG
jgi:hypothetical protein